MTTERGPIECWLTDMDGVLVHEEKALPGAAEFLERLVAKQRRFLVLTNNSIFTPRDLAARLASLSPQQFRVLVLVAQGLLNKQIADRLDVQERTVKAHLTAIFDRLCVRNRTQAGVVLRELELSDPARQIE